MPIAVLIYDLPTLARDVVLDTLASDAGIAVALGGSEHGPLDTAIDDTGASVVIVAADHPEVAPEVPPVLSERARLRVLALSADDESVIYELQPRRRPLGELSPAGLLDAVRR